MDHSSNTLTRLFEDNRKFLYNRGDTILRAGDTPSGVYLITSGWVKAYSLCSDGEPNIITSFGSGDIFPLSWALTESMRDVTFGALETTVVLRTPKEVFTRGIATDNEISRSVSHMLATHFLRLENELDNLHYRSARERVAFRLISLAENFGQHKANKVIFNIRVPNEYIARSSNMTRETASREMSRLARKGIIRNVRGYVAITDMEALKAEADHAASRLFDRRACA
jgi:CRP/FNR family transcriptional regulator